MNGKVVELGVIDDYAVGETSPVCFQYKPAYEIVKRLIDILCSLFGLIVLSPVFLVTALLIKLEDGGPVIYCARRVGRNGEGICIYKFRSMKRNAERLEDMLTPQELAEYRRNFKLARDPRITRIGNFIRKTSIDELPQLVNILRGELSIVGPRPVLEEETQLYGPYRSLLLSVKPGLTGLWQSKGRSRVTYETGERQRMELTYIAQRSMWFDVKIIFWTVLAVLKMDGAQ